MWLSWSLVGPVGKEKRESRFPVRLTQLSGDSLSKDLERLWKIDFQDVSCGPERTMSREDKYLFIIIIIFF